MLARVARRGDVILHGVIPVPVLHDAHVLAVRHQVAPRRKLIDAGEQRAVGGVRDEVHVVQRLAIPAKGNAELDERLHLGREVEGSVVDRVVQRLDAEAVARREQRAVAVIPDGVRELTAQRMHGPRALRFIEMQRDLAIRARSEGVPLALELRADALEVVELAVVNQVKPAVLARDRLVARRQVDDAETRVPEPNATARLEPDALRVRPAMGEATSRAMKGVGGHSAATRNCCNDAAHLISPWSATRSAGPA